jgi:hypothetical protein
VVLGAVLAGVVLAPPASADHPQGALTPYAWSCPDGTVPEDGFADVPPSNPHEQAVDCAVALGLARGTGARTYDPQRHVTRAQLATFVVPMLPDGDPETATTPPDAFDDDAGSVHEAAINRLAASGVVLGTGPRRFSPDALVTRAQMAAYLVRVTERARSRALPQARDHFADDDTSPHEPWIDRAASLGLTTGTAAGGYQPADAVRRDQMATFLTRTYGCSRWHQRGGPYEYHDPKCDHYTDTEGLQALQGFEVTVDVARHQPYGQPVPVTVRTCNRRSTPLRQTAPQKDWFVLEARHRDLVSSHDRMTPGSSDALWYDHRLVNAGTLDGAGYTPYTQRMPRGDVVLDRNPDLVTQRLVPRIPRLRALTWWNGPQTAPDQVAVWEPGQCHVLDVGAWGQGALEHGSPDSLFDFPTRWREPGSGRARTLPGWYAFRLHWGGVEVDQTRRYLTVDSSPTHLEGPRISVTRDKERYAPDEPVRITVRACNDGERPYREDVGFADSTGEHLFSVHAQSGSSFTRQQEIARVTPAEQALELAAGQCRSWDVSWDQRIGGEAVRPGSRSRCTSAGTTPGRPGAGGQGRLLDPPLRPGAGWQQVRGSPQLRPHVRGRLTRLSCSPRPPTAGPTAGRRAAARRPARRSRPPAGGTRRPAPGGRPRRWPASRARPWSGSSGSTTCTPTPRRAAAPARPR